MNIKKWVLANPDKNVAREIARECDINPFLALLLVSKGIETPEQAVEFLVSGDFYDDPFAFADIDTAVGRILDAISEHEKIMIYGDYDVDGITSTAVLYLYLREKGAQVRYRIPTRKNDGYGLNRNIIDEAVKNEISLLITVDNGITAVDEVRYAKEKNIDVIITDHHKPPEEIPNAYAVVNPLMGHCESTFKHYSGVGVVFKLLCALEGDDQMISDKYIDLVAIGTLSDVMPLIDENREIVRRGIQSLNSEQRVGIRALLNLLGQENKYITSQQLTFGLVPNLNSAGRIDDATLALELLLTEDSYEADKLARKLVECNQERRSIEAKIIDDVMRKISESDSICHDRILVVCGEGWDTGVVGIIASRVVERYGKPCILLCSDGENASGSGRSISGFNIYDAVASAEGLLVQFGGHELAAGLTIKKDDVDNFRKAVNNYAYRHFEKMPVPQINMAFKLKPSQINTEKISLISALEPLGADNKPPLFGLYDMQLDNIVPVANGKHLRLSVSRDGENLTAMLFQTTVKQFAYQCGQIINMAVSIERNEFRGTVTPSLFVRDIRAAGVSEDELMHCFYIFDKIQRGEFEDLKIDEKDKPNRELIASVYRFLRQKNEWSGNAEQLHFYLGEKSTYLAILIAAEMLKRAKLIMFNDMGTVLNLKIVQAETGQSDAKIDLNDIPLAKKLGLVL